ncbi:uncharacterized protein LOC125040484 [Penaeus chinensis]|uniref:uncharacterized protein LOC125040484 n=1 Tax=Penaeus chinensis TaxID=139456 RepID=UPI001FB7E036|nr:uncharacterized protein LOC125040484 [Penaeus chinensis]
MSHITSHDVLDQGYSTLKSKGPVRQVPIHAEVRSQSRKYTLGNPPPGPSFHFVLLFAWSPGSRCTSRKVRIRTAGRQASSPAIDCADTFEMFKSRIRSLYAGMDVVGLVERLLRKRPATFFACGDQYLLRDGTRGAGGFERIGTPQEAPPLCLRDYLSYDEMKLSALLAVSSRSFFVNDGSRHNKGVPGTPGTFAESGVIVGMVGARLKKTGYMEWQDCLVTPTQNTEAKGYGGRAAPSQLQALWARMWGRALPTWSDAGARDEGFLRVSKNMLLNVGVYKARMRLTAEVLLAEAGARAAAEGLKAYVHVVGLGLGVWRASKDQDAMFVDAWGEALQAAPSTARVAHVDFSWIGAEVCQGVRDGQRFPGTDVTIHFSRRALHDPVPAGTTLVVSYAWDGNSLPGNEYWVGKLSSTGDGAAACSSQVAELHNTHINANVSGANLHVAGPWGVAHVAEYARRSPSHAAKRARR